MATIHDNDFRLEMTGLSNFSFTVSEYFITSGQPWKGVTTKSDKTGATITAHAGRKASKDTADWFVTAIGGGSAIGCSTIDKLPKELNFAFKGTMAFTHGGKDYKGTEIVIAQGSTAAFRNNWWIGGPKMSTAIDLPAGFLSIIYQNFGLTAKVSFTTTAGDVSKMSMGILAL